MKSVCFVDYCVNSVARTHKIKVSVCVSGNSGEQRLSEGRRLDLLPTCRWADVQYAVGSMREVSTKVAVNLSPQ